MGCSGKVTLCYPPPPQKRRQNTPDLGKDKRVNLAGRREVGGRRRPHGGSLHKGSGESLGVTRVPCF